MPLLRAKLVRPPCRVTLRRQTRALGFCKVRAARTRALHRRAATPQQTRDVHSNRGARCCRHGCTRRATGRHVAHTATNCSVAHRAIASAGTLRRGHRSVHETATPETPVATAAAPGAPHGESHTAPNSAGSEPTNLSGSPSSTSANRQSTVVVEAAATPTSTSSTAHRDRSSGGVGGHHLFAAGGRCW